MIDRFVLHPVFGYLFFMVSMTLLFASIYWMAQPLMDLIESSFSTINELIKGQVSGLFGDFLTDGLVAGIGGVVIFLPQIFILFLGIGFLESSGYLARVAALIDRPLAMVGLGGRSFVPLLSGFACAVPAIMATRNITSKKEKLLAQFIIPFMTCSARIPVYALLIGFIFADSSPLKAGFFMAILYFSAIVFGALAAGVISIFIKSKENSRLLLDLPIYRQPRLKILLVQAYDKSISFIKRAGPIILILSMVLWVATTFPKPEATTLGSMNTVQMENTVQYSYAAQAGKAIEPIFQPMGIDWRVGFAVISAFAAREVFVSALALIFSVDAEDEDQQALKLNEVMANAQFENGDNKGKPIFTVASCVGLLIFFMLALQCLSTYAILKKESGGHKLAMAQLIVSNVVAYGLAVSAVKILTVMGLGA